MLPRYLCACVSLIICLSIGSGFIPFPFSFSHSTHDLIRGENSADRLLADLSSWPYQNIKPAFNKGFRAFLSEDKPAFLRVGLISHLFGRHLVISPVLFVASWQFLLVFSPCESCYFWIFGPILLKLHILAHLIESFPTVYGLCSCIKIKMPIPLAAHSWRSSMERDSSANFLVLRPVLLKNAYFSSPNRELSKGVRLV